MLSAGSAVIFHGRLWHTASLNTSSFASCRLCIFRSADGSDGWMTFITGRFLTKYYQAPTG